MRPSDRPHSAGRDTPSSPQRASITSMPRAINCCCSSPAVEPPPLHCSEPSNAYTAIAAGAPLPASAPPPPPHAPSAAAATSVATNRRMFSPLCLQAIGSTVAASNVDRIPQLHVAQRLATAHAEVLGRQFVQPDQHAGRRDAGGGELLGDQSIEVALRVNGAAGQREDAHV